MKKYLPSALLFSLFSVCYSLFSAPLAHAFCPVCTVAAASAVGLSRWLGVDDTISGVWLGGLTIAIIFWTIDWMNKRNWYFWGRNFLTAIVYYTLILIPFYKTDIISFHPANMLWGVDKLLLGIAFGSILILIGQIVYMIVKKRNGGHAHFPFEKLVFDFAPLLIMSAIFYFITRK